MMHWKLLFAALFFTQALTAQRVDTIPMVWEKNHSALLLPVDIRGMPPGRLMQFDLGSPHTIFYVNPLTEMRDTLFNFSFRVGETDFSPKAVPIRQTGAEGALVGTLGADFITGRVAIFDYLHDRLLLADSLPANYNISLQPFYFAGGRVLLPASFDGRQTIVYFDTGSSAFSLLTDSVTWARLAVKNSVPTEYTVNSWGKTLTAHTVASRDSMLVAGRQIPLQQVSYISGVSAGQVEQMQKMGIGGMIGNAFFQKRILILDTKQQRFGVLEKQ